MPRTDRVADSDRPTGASERNRSVSDVGRSEVGDPRTAAAAVARAMCATGTVDHPAIAEGLASTGARSAALAFEPHDATALVGRGAWVSYRVGEPGSAASAVFAAELVPAGAQDVVDLGLVAHRVAEARGRPVCVTIDPGLVGRLEPYRMPERDVSSDPARAARVSDASADAPDVSEAFARVGAFTGRSRSPVETIAGRDGSLRVIAFGAGAGAVRDALRRGDASGSCVIVHVAEPFPVESLVDALRGARGVAVLGTGPLATRASDVVRSLGIPVRHVEAIDAAAVAEAIGLSEASSGDDAAVRRIAVAPSDAASDAALRSAAGLWASVREIHLDRVDLGGAHVATLAVASAPIRVSSDGFDVTVLTGAGESAERALAALTPSGTVVLAGAEAQRTFAPRVDALAKAGFDVRACPSSPPSLGVLVRLLDLDATFPGAFDEADDEFDVESLRAEAETLVPFDAARLDEGGARAARFPKMPEARAEADGWRERVRRFHLTGERPPSWRPSPLRPAAFRSEAIVDDPSAAYPLVSRVEPSNVAEAPEPAVFVEPFVDRARRAFGGAELSIVGEHLPRLARALEREIASRGGSVRLAEAIGPACEALARGLDVTEAGRRVLEEELAKVGERLASDTRAIALGDGTLLSVYAEQVAGVRSPLARSAKREAERLVARLEERLRMDDGHAPESREAGAIAAGLGSVGSEWIDPSALSSVLPEERGPKRLEPTRRARIEAAIVTLRDWCEAPDDPVAIVVARDDAAATYRHPEPLRAAIGIFRGQVARRVDVVRALRTARLEAQGAYEPELHDRVLASLDWDGMTAEELLALPPVVAIESADRLRGPALAAFSSLLRSGYPVHVLVSESPSGLAASETWEALASSDPGLGYLAIAHREALVVESTLCRPAHLAAGLARVSVALRPAVAFVAVPSPRSAAPPWVQLETAHAARLTPCFVYDADAGSHWADRFDLSDNPAVERPWPLVEVPYEDERGRPSRFEQSLTWAHAVALDPAFAEQFMTIPPEAWSDAQVEIADWVDRPSRERVRLVPYLWVVDDDSLARAILTREAALACRDRLRAWRVLQELAGTDDEYARRAADAARADALAEAEDARKELEQSHAREVEEVRSRAASEAMDRLVRVLLDVDSMPLPSAEAPVATATASAPAPSGREVEPEPSAPPPEPEEEEDVSFSDPYIDSILCTTCHECTNLNPRMFQYDGNKQAFIADASAGTFEELVKAAEKCPARCIHPGEPRDGDATASPELVARAAKFN